MALWLTRGVVLVEGLESFPHPVSIAPILSNHLKISPGNNLNKKSYTSFSVRDPHEGSILDVDSFEEVFEACGLQVDLDVESPVEII